MCSPHKNRGAQTRQLDDGIGDTLVLALEVLDHAAANIGAVETANGLQVVFRVKRRAARICGTAELGSLSHVSTVEQPQARADYFSYGIHGEGKNLVGHNLIWLLS